MKTVGKRIEPAAPDIARIREGVWVVPSRSVPGVLHVTKLVAGQLVCSCDADFLGGGRCWHKDAVQKLISEAKRPPTALGLSLLTGGRLGSQG